MCSVGLFNCGQRLGLKRYPDALPFADMLSCLQLFLCADLWKDAGMLHAAYCDSQGVTESFIKNGLANALNVLGIPMPLKACDWTYDVVVNADLQQVSGCGGACAPYAYRGSENAL